MHDLVRQHAASARRNAAPLFPRPIAPWLCPKRAHACVQSPARTRTSPHGILYMLAVSIFLHSPLAFAASRFCAGRTG